MVENIIESDYKNHLLLSLFEVYSPYFISGILISFCLFGFSVRLLIPLFYCIGLIFSLYAQKSQLFPHRVRSFENINNHHALADFDFAPQELIRNYSIRPHKQ